MRWRSTMLLFVGLDGLRVSAEIGFSVPPGLKPLVFGDKCLLCGNAVWLTDRAQSLISPLPARRTWINHLHGKATVRCWNSCLELRLSRSPPCTVRKTHFEPPPADTNRSSAVRSSVCRLATFNLKSVARKKKSRSALGMHNSLWKSWALTAKEVAPFE